VFLGLRFGVWGEERGIAAVVAATTDLLARGMAL